MIEYKELSALPFTEYVTVKRPKTERWCDNSFHAYSAELYTTKRGVETLRICIYHSKKYGTKSDPLRITERFYINSLGDVGGEEYSGTEFYKSDHSVGTSGFDCFEKYNQTRSLIDECIGSNWIALKKADKIILDFAERHEALKKAVPRNKRKYTSGICWAAFYQQYVREQKAKQAEINRKARTEARMRDIGEAPKEFFDWVYDDVLDTAPWFYRYDRKKQQKGFCGSCRKPGVLEAVKNNVERVCPVCGRKVRLVNLNARGNHEYVRYYTTAIYTERHGDGFLSRFFFLEKSFRYNDELTFKHSVKSTVNWNREHHEYRRTFWSVSGGKIAETEHYFHNYYANEWDRIPPKRAEQDRQLGPIYPGNILEITRSLNLPRVKNMDLRPLCLINTGSTPAQMFRGVSLCPAIESMPKMGLNNLARHYLGVLYYDNEFKPEGSPAKLLGIDKNVLAEFARIDVTYQQVVFWRSNKLKLSDLEAFKQLCARYKQKYSDIGDLMKEYGISLQAAMNYIERQRAYVKDYPNILRYWSDYLRTARLLNMDLKMHNVKFPRDIKTEHDRCTKLYEVHKNEYLEANLERRGELLEKLSYSDDRFVIEPLRTCADFVNESAKLNHCVKTYVKSCAAGETNIFGLRKKGRTGQAILYCKHRQRRQADTEPRQKQLRAAAGSERIR